MAAFFTLPELRAELHALGHDDIPDHVILSFLSQLHIALPDCFPPSPKHNRSIETNPEAADAVKNKAHKIENTASKELIIEPASSSEMNVQNTGRENARIFSRCKQASNARKPMQPCENVTYGVKDKNSEDKSQGIADLRLSVVDKEHPSHNSLRQDWNCYDDAKATLKQYKSCKLRAKPTLKSTNFVDGSNREESESASDSLQSALETCERDLLALNLRCRKQKQSKEELLLEGRQDSCIARKSDKHKTDNDVKRTCNRPQDSFSEVESDTPSESVRAKGKPRVTSKAEGSFVKRGGKIDRVARFAEMQKLWNKDSFLRATSGKRKSQRFHRMFADLHADHLRKCATTRMRSVPASSQRSELPPFVLSI